MSCVVSRRFPFLFLLGGEMEKQAFLSTNCRIQLDFVDRHLKEIQNFVFLFTTNQSKSLNSVWKLLCWLQFSPWNLISARSGWRRNKTNCVVLSLAGDFVVFSLLFACNFNAFMSRCLCVCVLCQRARHRARIVTEIPSCFFPFNLIENLIFFKHTTKWAKLELWPWHYLYFSMQSNGK